MIRILRKAELIELFWGSFLYRKLYQKWVSFGEPGGIIEWDYDSEMTESVSGDLKNQREKSGAKTLNKDVGIGLKLACNLIIYSK